MGDVWPEFRVMERISLLSHALVFVLHVQNKNPHNPIAAEICSCFHRTWNRLLLLSPRFVAVTWSSLLFFFFI